MMAYHWYGLIANHFHEDVDTMWNCPGCLKVIREKYPIYKENN